MYLKKELNYENSFILHELNKDEVLKNIKQLVYYLRMRTFYSMCKITATSIYIYQ